MAGLGGTQMDHVERRQREGLELILSSGRLSEDWYF